MILSLYNVQFIFYANFPNMYLVSKRVVVHSLYKSSFFFFFIAFLMVLDLETVAQYNSCMDIFPNANAKLD